jgi:hypothetical protein
VRLRPADGLDGLARIDIVTDTALSAGLCVRLVELLPGLEECRPRDLDAAVPVLIAPPTQAERLWFLYRDREHELAEVARRVKVQWDGPLDDVALVYQRPLPYLYLARQLLDAAGMPYEATDALPLAAEPRGSSTSRSRA